MSNTESKVFVRFGEAITIPHDCEVVGTDFIDNGRVLTIRKKERYWYPKSGKVQDGDECMHPIQTMGDWMQAAKDWTIDEAIGTGWVYRRRTSE